MPGAAAFDVWSGGPDKPRQVGKAIRIGNNALLAAVTEDGPVTVGPAGGTPSWPASPRWTGRGIALLEFGRDEPGGHGPGLPPFAAPVRWASISGVDGWTEARIEPQPGPVVTLHPLARSAAGLLTEIDGEEPCEPGRAVSRDGLVVGVSLTAHEGHLVVVPVGDLGADTAFCETFAQLTGRRFVCELLSLTGVLQPWTVAWAPPTPVRLLGTEQETVPFVGRALERERLSAWCRSGAALSVLAVTGAPGSGKTRIVREVAADLQPEWAVGVLSEAPPSDWLDRICASDRPLLVIVDRPQYRRQHLLPLITRLASRAAGHAVRIVLTASTTADWYAAIRAATAVPGHIWEPEPIDLPPLSATAAQQHHEDAAAAFARVLGLGPKPSGAPLRAGASPLDIHRAALAALLRGEGADDDRSVLVQASLRAWDERAERRRGPGAAAETLRHAVLRMVLTCPPPPDEAREWLRTFGTAVAVYLDEWVDWLTVILPPADPAASQWGAPMPDGPQRDVLAALIRPHDVEPMLKVLQQKDFVRVLAVLWALGAQETGASGTADAMAVTAALTELVSEYPPGVGPAALAVVAADPAVSPLLAALHAAVRDGTATIGRCRQISADLPDDLGGVANLAADVAETLMQHAGTDNSPDDTRGHDAATAARAHLAAGRPAFAASHADEAVRQYRTVVSHPGGALMRPLLIEAWCLYARALRESQRTAEAVRELRDAAEQCRQTEPDAARRCRSMVGEQLLRCVTDLLDAAEPELALAIAAARECIALFDVDGPAPQRAEAARLLGWAGVLAGDEVAALDALRRARDAYGVLALDNPGLYRPALATVLDQQATALALAGDYANAVSVGEEALLVQRQLVPASLDEPHPTLIRMLDAQASRLAAAGDSQRATDLALEAMRRAQRPGSDARSANPAVIGAAATVLCLRLAERGDMAGAERCAQQAVDVYVRLADGEDRVRYIARFAAALNNHAAVLIHLGIFGPARNAAQQAIRLWREPAVRTPQHRADLAAVLHNAALATEGLGLLEEALAQAQAAVEEFSSVDHVHWRLSAHHHSLALRSVIDLAGAVGDNDAAYSAAHALVDVQRRSLRADRDEYERRLADALDRYVALALLQPSPPWTTLLPAAEEAVTLYTGLSHADATRFGPSAGAAQFVLARALVEAGQEDAAVRVGKEAAEVLRRTVDDGRTDQRDALAEALTWLSRMLAGRDDEAAADFAAQIVDCRAADPGRRAELPQALVTLSARSAAAGDQERAMRAVDEAVRVGDRLIAEGSIDHRPGHVTALLMLAQRRRAHPEYATAPATILEPLSAALEMLIQLVKEGHTAELHRLADAAVRVAELERELQRYPQSLHHYKVAVEAHRRISAGGDETLAMPHAWALLHYSRALRVENEHLPEALAASRAAVELLDRRLADGDASARRPLIESLRQLSAGPRFRRGAERRAAAVRADQLEAEGHVDVELQGDRVMP